MSLERRLTEALHQADDYRPSVDLFARLSRSIEEDRIHRRRIRKVSVAVVGWLVSLAGFLIAFAERDSNGVVALPKWSVQLVILALLTSCLLLFGPAIRRLGQPYLVDVFHMSPAAGERFSRLLDVAYYLFFGGGMISTLDLTEIGSLVPAAESLKSGSEAVAVFLTVLGVAHVGNLFALPIVGMLFSSVTRRARRRIAGSDAPQLSEQARKTDRLVIAIVITAVLLVIGGGILGIALGLRGL